MTIFVKIGISIHSSDFFLNEYYSLIKAIMDNRNWRVFCGGDHAVRLFPKRHSGSGVEEREPVRTSHIRERAETSRVLVRASIE